jgi:hypothetical protein
MALTQDLYQPDALRGPQWRQSRLNGVSMAGAGVTGIQLLAGPAWRRPGAADGIHAPDGWTS